MKSLDVVVVGGGIAGLSVAWGLVRAGGARVTLLERERLLASQASGNNAAIFRVIDGDPVAVALALRSRALFAELGAPTEVLRRTGGLYLGAPAELDALAALGAGAGIATERIDRDGLAARVPALAGGDAPGGLFVAEDGVLDLHALAETLVRAARAAGATIETGVTITRIDRDEDGRVAGVACSDGRTFPANAVVVAAGAWAADLGATAGAALPVLPVRRHLALLAAPEGVPAGGPVVWRLGQEVYFRPESGGVLASPCDEETWPAEDPPASPAALDQLAERLAPTAPGLASSAVRRSLACLRTFAPDRSFVAGPDPRVRGLYWIAGLGGHGMTCGVALGELVAASVLGRAPPTAPGLAARVAPGRLLARGPVRALILDLDGTLADTLDDLTAAVNHVLASLGLPARTRDEIRSFVGEGAASLVRRALPPSHAHLGEDALAAFRAHYAAHLVVATRPYPGIPEALAALEERRFPLAVLSNKPQPLTEAVVRALFPGVRFASVFGERPGLPRKPDPTSALLVAEALGVPPSEIALVGDGATDVGAARAAGMHAIGATWGFRPREELLEAGATRLLESPAELLGFAEP